MRSPSFGHDQAETLRRMVLYNSASPVRRSRVITVTSGKGGVGKSTVALNLALKLSEFENNILLVDANANLGKLDVMAGVSPRYRLGDVLRGDRIIEEVICPLSPSVKLLAGNSGDVNYPAFERKKHERLLQSIVSTKEHFDYIIVDTSAGLTEDVISTAAFSNLTIIVSNAEPIAVLDAYAIIKMIRSANASTSIKLLMNGASKPYEADEAGDKLRIAVKHFLNYDLPYLGSIPHDSHVSEAITQQQPLVKRYSSCGAGLSLELLARSIHSSFQQQTRTRTIAI